MFCEFYKIRNEPVKFIQIDQDAIKSKEINSDVFFVDFLGEYDKETMYREIVGTIRCSEATVEDMEKCFKLLSNFFKDIPIGYL